MRHLSLFSGIGGDSLAAAWAGFETVAFCEKDQYCQQVLMRHWPGVAVYGDIHQLDGGKYPDTTLLTGGFPCQPFSIAGPKRGEGDERDLWPEMFRVIEQCKPRWVVGENVAHFAHMGLDRSITDMEAIGYEVGSVVLPACSVQAPHVRERLFIVAHANCNDSRQRAIAEGQGQAGQSGDTDGRRGQIESRMGGEADGIPGWLDGTWELGIPRATDKTKNRRSRLRALGNAVVPQQIYPIFHLIADLEA